MTSPKGNDHDTLPGAASSGSLMALVVPDGVVERRCSRVKVACSVPNEVTALCGAQSRVGECGRDEPLDHRVRFDVGMSEQHEQVGPGGGAETGDAAECTPLHGRVFDLGALDDADRDEAACGSDHGRRFGL